MSKHKITTCRSGSFGGMDWETEYRITFTHTKGSSDYWNKSGGHWEQGWAAELDLVSVDPVFGASGTAFIDLGKGDIDEWASNWLIDDGYAEAMEVVASDDERGREYAAELRADR